MVIREDRDLNISINQYKIIKEISAGINSRVERLADWSIDLHLLLPEWKQILRTQIDQ